MTSSARARVSALLALPLALGLMLAAAGTAQAVAAPKTPAFGAAIESYPGWVSEQGCQAGVRPGVTAVVETILKPTYGGTAGDYLGQRACSPTKESAHDDGKALDWMMNLHSATERANAESFLAWLHATDTHGNADAMYRRLGIMYVIWDNKMLRLYSISRGWQPYSTYVNGVKTDCALVPAKAYDTSCHRDHVHISFTPDGANQRTSYWTTPQPQTPPTVPPTATPTRTLRITTKPFTTHPGAVSVRGTAVTAGAKVQLYIRRPGTTAWIAILTPRTSSSTGVWKATYTTGRSHDLQVRVGTSRSNTVRVTVD